MAPRRPLTTGTIILSKRLGSWVADMSGVSEAAIIQDLFGSTLLPTPYTERSAPAVVQRTIQALNPRCVVIVAA